MRYLVQFLVPAMIIIGVAYVIARQKSVTKQKDADALSTPVFLLVLVIGALFTIAILYAIGAMTEV